MTPAEMDKRTREYRRRYRFQISHRSLGFWTWRWTGHGIANIEGGGGHLPRRSRAAAEAAARRYAERKYDEQRDRDAGRVELVVSA